MFELDLSRCPICQTSRRLIRQMREVQGKHFIWYECPECASALLWLGKDRWIYQQVGRDDKRYLLKRPLTTAELQALSAAAPAYLGDEEPAAATPAYFRDEPKPVDTSYEYEPEPLAPVPDSAPPPVIAETEATARPKGMPKSLAIAVAIIALLCVIAAVAIIATQL